MFIPHFLELIWLERNRQAYPDEKCSSMQDKMVRKYENEAFRNSMDYGGG